MRKKYDKKKGKRGRERMRWKDRRDKKDNRRKNIESLGERKK